MDDHRRQFHRFLALHVHKAPPTETPVAYLQFASADTGPRACLIKFDREQVMAELDCEAELVRWLLHQMSTYDCTTQRIVGLVFDKRTVLSEVLRCAP